MTTAERLLQEALRLSPQEREDLALRLAESLGEEKDPACRSYWETEIRRRLEEIHSGAADLIEWDDALRGIFGSAKS